MEGKTQTNDVDFYNLDDIIAMGYRVTSLKATRFRQWCLTNKAIKAFLKF